MNKSDVIRQLIIRTKDDFTSYYNNSKDYDTSNVIIYNVLHNVSKLTSMRDVVDALIPDTNDDGGWECSYALNTGVMILNLIDYLSTNNEQYYQESITLFFDTVDFKVQQALEKQGIPRPTEEQISKHSLYITETDWVDSITKDNTI